MPVRSTAVRRRESDTSNADLVQDADLFHERAGHCRVGEYFAAGLDDEHLAFEEANVGRRVLQRRHDNRAVSFRCS